MVVGYVDEVNGNDAAEVSGFAPTRRELLQLVEYWKLVALKIEFWEWFITGVVGSSDRRLREFALCRIDRIWKLLGKEEVRPAIDRVYAEFENLPQNVKCGARFTEGKWSPNLQLSITVWKGRLTLLCTDGMCRMGKRDLG
jgi:hypothetical protein